MQLTITVQSLCFACAGVENYVLSKGVSFHALAVCDKCVFLFSECASVCIYLFNFYSKYNKQKDSNNKELKKRRFASGGRCENKTECLVAITNEMQLSKGICYSTVH